MRDLIQVICENLDRTIEVEMGTSLLDIQRQYLPKGPHPYLAAYVNNRIKELNYKVYTPITVRYIDATPSKASASTNARRRSSSNGPSASSIPNTSSTSATRCCAASTAKSRGATASPPEAEAIRTRMEELVDAAIPIIRSRVRSIDAAMEFTRLGFDDKTELLNTRPRLYSTLYSLGDMKGLLLRRARPVDRLHPPVRHPPLLQRFLRRTARTQPPDALKPLVAQDKLFDIFHQYKEWVDIMGVPTVGRLNAKVLAGDASELIKIAEAFHETAGAYRRHDRRGQPLAGNAHGTHLRPLVERQDHLGQASGHPAAHPGAEPVLISLDDYFVNRDKTPRDADGEYDYEALEAIDLRLFNDHLQRLFAGESLPCRATTSSPANASGTTIRCGSTTGRC